MQQLWFVLRLRLTDPKVRIGLIGYGLVMALLIAVAYTIFWRELPQIDPLTLLGRVGWDGIARATLIYTFDLALAVTCWTLVLGTLSGFWQPGHHLRIYTITSVTRRLPGTFWYVLGRVVMYERLGVPRSLTVLAGGLEFGLVTLGGLLVVVITFPLVLGQSGLNLAWLVLALLGGVALLSPPVVRALMRRFSPSFDPRSLGYCHLITWLVLYALVWAVGGGIVWVLVDAVHPISLVMLPTLIGVWAASGVLVSLFTFLPISLGAHEITLASLLSLFIDPGEALLVALLMRAVLTGNEILWALIGALLSMMPWARLPPEPRSFPAPVDSEALSSRR